MQVMDRVWGDDAHLMLMHGAKPDAVMHTRKIQSHLQPWRFSSVSRHRQFTPIDTSRSPPPPRPHAAMSNKTKEQKPAKGGRSAIDDVVAREYTIHLHKRVRSV